MAGGFLPPLSVIASWPAPNYKDPATQPRYVLIFSCIIGPISIAMLLARLWARIRMQNSAGWDDWLMLAAAFPVLALTIILPLITEVYRFNRHVWDVEPHYYPIQRKFIMAIYSLFSLASGLIKLSILLFYRRLSSRAVSPAFRWIMRITIFIIGGYTIAFVIIPPFICQPIAAFWNQVNVNKIAEGYEYKCINEGVDVISNGIISTIQDFVVAFLPTILCWNLQMPIRQKIALYAIFTLGYASVAIGAVRTYTGWQSFYGTYDVTWVASNAWLWSLLELHIGSMCANAPALKVFFAKILKGPLQQSYVSRKSKNSGAASTLSTPSNKSWISTWFEKVLPTRSNNSSFQSQTRTIGSTNSRGTRRQMDAYFDTDNPPSPRDSMTKPLACEYIDTTMENITRDGHTHDVEMNRLPTSHSSVNYDVHALSPA